MQNSAGLPALGKKKKEKTMKKRNKKKTRGGRCDHLVDNNYFVGLKFNGRRNQFKLDLGKNFECQ